jgi:uncharacterized membrane protein YdjX (TVP38/TMEM64 family)
MERDKRRLLIFIALLVVLTGALSVALWPFIRGLGEPAYREKFGVWVESLGWKGPLVILGIQIFQILVAVIPGEPVELLAGAAYGALGGLALCLAGSLIAQSLIFLMVRKFGAPLVERLFRAAGTGRFAFLKSAQKTSFAVFILFLIPGTPKDTLSYLVPLSPLGPGRFLLLSTLARIPSVLSSTTLGARAARGDWVVFLLVFLGIAALGIGGILFSGEVVNRLRGPRGGL